MPGNVACFHGVTGSGWSNEPVTIALGERAALAAARLADDGEVDDGGGPPMPDARLRGAGVDEEEGGAIGGAACLGALTDG